MLLVMQQLEILLAMRGGTQRDAVTHFLVSLTIIVAGLFLNDHVAYVSSNGSGFKDKVII